MGVREHWEETGARNNPHPPHAPLPMRGADTPLYNPPNPCFPTVSFAASSTDLNLSGCICINTFSVSNGWPGGVGVGWVWGGCGVGGAHHPAPNKTRHGSDWPREGAASAKPHGGYDAGDGDASYRVCVRGKTDGLQRYPRNRVTIFSSCLAQFLRRTTHTTHPQHKWPPPRRCQR